MGPRTCSPSSPTFPLALSAPASSSWPNWSTSPTLSARCWATNPTDSTSSKMCPSALNSKNLSAHHPGLGGGTGCSIHSIIPQCLETSFLIGQLHYGIIHLKCYHSKNKMLTLSHLSHS